MVPAGLQATTTYLGQIISKKHSSPASMQRGVYYPNGHFARSPVSQWRSQWVVPELGVGDSPHSLFVLESELAHVWMSPPGHGLETTPGICRCRAAR